MRYAFIEAQRSNYAVALLCRLLEVSEQGFYQWRKRPTARRKLEDQRLGHEVQMIHAESKQRYGSPRIYHEFRERGQQCSRKRVERLMRERSLRARAARKFRATTDSSHSRPVAENHLNREFLVPAPNQTWVGDITYLWTKEGWLYLAVFIDLYSRMVVGWALGTRLSAELALTAWQRACLRRRPGAGLLVHTDRGVQYTADGFSKALEGICAKLSMSRKGNCWDNAVAESFFHSFKVEAIDGFTFETRKSMEYEVFDYIERFYNRVRRHSSIGYRSPEQFERVQIEQRIAA